MEKYLLLLFSITFSQTQWNQVDIPDNQNMVKLIADGNGLYGATSSASIYYSSDNGINWESLPMHPDIFPYSADLFEKVDDYLFFSQNIGGSTYNYRTFYNGEYWEDWEILPYDESIIYEFVNYENAIYALLDQGISISSDYGISWELIETPEISGYIHLQYVNDEYLYINNGCNLYRYRIETNEWTDITGILDDIGPPEPYSCTSISQIEKFSNRLIISVYWYGGVGTLFYSETDGDSWEIISSFPSISSLEYGHNNVSAMTAQSGTLYAGTASSQDGIFYTQNLIDWMEYSAGLSSYNLSVSALAVTEEKIYKLGGTANLFQNALIEAGCTDPEACNYDETANIDDGSCAYEIDCGGTCGGELVWDCAGICGGDNSTYDGCCSLPPNDDCTDDCYIDFLGACCIEEDADECGLCFGDGTSCCESGETNNDNPCNPWECYDGQWVEIIIDCAEQEGIPCEGGAYVPPEEGECCSDCVLYGDLNGDGTINVIDIVMAVGLILSNNYDAVGDVNEDGLLNVIDVVMLVNGVLNGIGCSDGSSWDYDMDGICDTDDTDNDNDNDGALDATDSNDNNEYVCSDVDGDNCDDCSSGTFDPANDGPDYNENGICDEGEASNDTDGDGVIDDEDSDPYNPYQCSDNDWDTCDDCLFSYYNPSEDGYDYDGDGQCDASDCDDDNHGCQECWD